MLYIIYTHTYIYIYTHTHVKCHENRGGEMVVIREDSLMRWWVSQLQLL